MVRSEYEGKFSAARKPMVCSSLRKLCVFSEGAAGACEDLRNVGLESTV